MQTDRQTDRQRERERERARERETEKERERESERQALSLSLRIVSCELWIAVVIGAYRMLSTAHADCVQFSQESWTRESARQ